MNSKEAQIKAGLGVMIFKDGKILMGKRKNSHGDGEYAFPGGHLEFGESMVDCVKRETREETGVEIKNVRFLYCANLVKYEKHYVQFGFIADWKSGEAKNVEKECCGGWDWYLPNNLPKPFFGTVEWYLEAQKTGKKFFDSK